MNMDKIVIHERNIITCINSFYFGMIAIKFKRIFFENRIILACSAVILVILSFFKINTSFVLVRQIQGFSLYIFLRFRI